MSIDSMEMIIESSEIYKALSLNYNNLEIWDDDFIEDGWSYWNIVSNNSGIVRKLAYLRIKDNAVQKRTYDEQGDDLWVSVK
ncbi:hypothetical protein [Microbulbifer sp. PAAF003]|uniref:hypothetical protein n=1 Tax=Microbulbifer sp. PAAF003 TaxID=3243375 RepID=UPI00403A3B5E